MTTFVEEDRKLLEAVEGTEKYDDIFCAITTYRYPDTLHVGDSVPDLTLMPLDESGTFQLAAKRKRPLLLIFGSYT